MTMGDGTVNVMMIRNDEVGQGSDDQEARFLKVCRYDQLRRNSCYDELGCNSLVVIALLLLPA